MYFQFFLKITVINVNKYENILFYFKKITKKIFIFSFFILFFHYKIKYLFNYYLFI